MFSIIVLIVFLNLASSSHLDDCQVGLSFRNESMNKFKTFEFKYNEPKETEVLRTKVYFKYPKPVFSVYNSPHQIVFGKFKTNIIY